MIAYLRLAPYAIGLILLVGLLWYRGEAIQAEAERDLLQDRLNIALAQNREKEETIGLLRDWKAKTDDLMTGLTAKIEQLAADSQDLVNEITNLGKTDADAKAWLDTVVPDSVRCLLKRKRDRKQDCVPVPNRASGLRHERARSRDKRRPG